MLLNISLFKLNKTILLFVLATVLCYFYFGYFLVRTDYIKLTLLYSALFLMFYKLFQTFKSDSKALSYLAFGFRAVFILAIPNLSQDFYRFIWDGQMLLEGFNPYLYTVESFIAKNEFPVANALELHQGMGTLNASHFTNYPPINQLCFVLANLFPGNSILSSVIGLRLIIIAADFGTLHFGKKLLEKLKLPTYLIFLYILNPFIIIELTGNLHFEGVMIFFLIWGLYLLHIEKWPWAAVVLTISISVKLMPLMFLPLLFQWFLKRDSNKTLIRRIGNLLKFYSIIGITLMVLFIPFYSNSFIKNYSSTVALWFQNFEFNASIYYLVREIGYGFRGHNEIAIIGKLTAISAFVFVLILAFLRNNKNGITLITTMLFALSFYYFTATTIHPWYVATLLILSVFTQYRFPLVWSFTIVLSYLAYVGINNNDKHENFFIIAIEYAVVYSYLIWEIFIKKAPKLEA